MRLFPGLATTFVLHGILAGAAPAPNQSPQPQKLIEQGTELLRQSHYVEAEALFAEWAAADPANPDAHFHLALSRALQGRFEEALTGFKGVLALDVGRADAYFEIAGVLFKLQRHREALESVQKGLRLAPEDQYGLQLAGTLSFLLDLKLEALRFWNRIGRPHLTGMTILSPSADRYGIAEEIDLKPGDLLSGAELEKAAWRLAQHSHIRQAQFNPVPGTSADAFDLEVRVDARSGPGRPLEFLFNSLGEIAFDTVRFDYWNLAKKGYSFHLPFRWDPRARHGGIRIENPRPLHLPVYVFASYDWRDEDWLLRDAQRERGSGFRLRRHELGTTLRVPLAIPTLAADIHMKYRWRRFENDPIDGPGLHTVTSAGNPHGVLWIGLEPSIRMAQTTSPVGWQHRGLLRLSLAAGRHYGTGAKDYVSRLSAGWESLMERTSGSGRSTVIRLGVHAGRTSPGSVAEDHFLLGVGPDAEFALRAHPVFDDSRKGSTPMAQGFTLANATLRQEFVRWGALRLGALGFVDVAHIGKVVAGQGAFKTVIDTGVGLELGSGPMPGRRLTFAYGRDLDGRRHTFYIGTRFPW